MDLTGNVGHAWPHTGDCALCAEEQRKAVEEQLLNKLSFFTASAFWFAQHSRYLKPNTIRSYATALRPLNAFFRDIIVEQIHVGHVRAYQDHRSAVAGAYCINGEGSVLQMVLKEAGCWGGQLQKLYRPLPVPKRRAGHSLDPDEELRLRQVAFSHPKWTLAAHCMMVMLSTTMGFGELRHVRRRDVDMVRRCVLVRDGAKNNYRDRTIPLNAAASESMDWILERWSRLGGTLDEEFILPHRPRTNKGPWIFTEPQTAITTAFRRIRKAAGLPHFRVYDCRVQAITKLLSNPMVSPQVSKEIAGHISQAMQDRYSIQQFDTKKAALDALETPHFAPKKPVEKIVTLPLDDISQSKIASRYGEKSYGRKRS